MGLRDALNKNPALSTGIVAGIVVLVLVFVVYSMSGGGGGGASDGGGAKLWFTDDDGATFFADDASKIAPFDHNGKAAVACFVFTCDGGKTKFVGYLERCTPELKARREKARQNPGSPDIGLGEDAGQSGLETKAPKSGTWVKSTDQRAAMIRLVKCPDGKGGEPEIVLPE